MNAITINERDTLPTAEEAEMAKVAQRMVVKALDHSRAQKIQIISEGATGEMPVLQVPPRALRLFADLLGAMARGETVTLVPHGHALTTQEAAAFLNVSRPYVIKLIDEGKLTCMKVGRHRRIDFDLLAAYRKKMKQESADALQALTDLDQEMGLGY